MDYSNAFGAEFRQVEDRNHEGRDVRVVVATRVYPTDRALYYHLMLLLKAFTNAYWIVEWVLSSKIRLTVGTGH